MLPQEREYVDQKAASAPVKYILKKVTSKENKMITMAKMT